MQKRAAFLAVTVISVALFLTGSTAFAANPALEEIRDVVEPLLQDIQGTVNNIESGVVDPTADLNQIKSDVQMLKTSLNDLDAKIDTLNSDISFIKAALTDDNSGLQKISDKVQDVETLAGIINTNVGTASSGINTIETEIVALSLTAVPAIQNTLDDPLTGLPAIKSETDKIQMVKDDVGTANTGIGTIETEIVALSLTAIPEIQRTLDDPDNGLGAIQTEILSLDLSGIEGGVTNIQATLDDQNIGLASLDNDHNSLGMVLLEQNGNIQMIKDTLDDPDNGLASIQTEILSLDLSGIGELSSITTAVEDTNTKINDVGIGLGAIKNNFDAISARDQNTILQILFPMRGVVDDTNLRVSSPDNGLSVIHSILDDPLTGLPAIKSETDKIQMVKDDVGTANTGIGTIETEIVALSLTAIPEIQRTLDDPDNGLASIQTEILSLDLSGIQRIENILDDPTDDPSEPNNIQMIKNELEVPQAKLFGDGNLAPRQSIGSVVGNMAAGHSPSFGFEIDLSRDTTAAGTRVIGIFAECDEEDGQACQLDINQALFNKDRSTFNEPTFIWAICADDPHTDNIITDPLNHCIKTDQTLLNIDLGIEPAAKIALNAGVAAGPLLSGTVGGGLGFALGTSIPITVPSSVESFPVKQFPSGGLVLHDTGVGGITGKKAVVFVTSFFDGNVKILGNKVSTMNVYAGFLGTDGVTRCLPERGPDGSQPVAGTCPAAFDAILRGYEPLATADIPAIFTGGEFSEYENVKELPYDETISEGDDIVQVTYTSQPRIEEYAALAIERPVYAEAKISPVIFDPSIDSPGPTLGIDVSSINFGELLNDPQVKGSITSVFDDIVAEKENILSFSDLFGKANNPILDDLTGEIGPLLDSVDFDALLPQIESQLGVTNISGEIDNIKSQVNVGFSDINSNVITPLNNFDPSISQRTLSTFSLPNGVSRSTANFNPCTTVGIGSCGITYTTGVSLQSADHSVTLPPINLDPNFNIPQLALLP